MSFLRIRRVRGASLAWLLALLPAFFVSEAALASSHREAPEVRKDPTADDTDFYLFRDPVDTSRVVMIGNWIPFEEPAGGPNFYNFNPDVRYEMKIDNDGDAVEDITYRFTFTRNVRNTSTFLYNVGPVTSISDTDLNVFYTYRVEKVLGPSVNASGANVTTIGNGLLEAPNNVGPKSFPGYETVSHGALLSGFSLDGGVRAFAGPRGDPFYVDLGMTFDLINLEARGAAPFGFGVNDLAGYNVHALALSIPINQLTANGSVPTATSDANAIISGWAATYRRATTVLGSNGGPATFTGDWVQVSRLGNPLVNEVVVPLGLKNQFNATEPKDDVQYASAILDPEVPKLFKALFNINSPPAPRNDLLVLVQGLDGLTKRPGEVISDQLRLNVAVAPTPIASVNRLGVIGGDNAGFPNGRRIYDDVVDIELRVLAGVLVSGFNVAPNNTLGDNVNGPDLPFLQSFPWAATPHSGFNHRHDHPNVNATSAVSATRQRAAAYAPDGTPLPSEPYVVPESH